MKDTQVDLKCDGNFWDSVSYLLDGEKTAQSTQCSGQNKERLFRSVT